MISVVMIKHMTKRNLGKNEFIYLTILYNSPSSREIGAGTPNRNLETVTQAITPEESHLVAYFTKLVHSPRLA